MLPKIRQKPRLSPFITGEYRFPALTCLFAGVLMGMTCDPVNAWFFAWIAFIPLWLWVVQQSSFSLQSIIPVFTFAIGYYGVTLFWITGVHPMTWMGVPWWNSLFIAIAIWLILIAWGSVLVTLWSLGMIPCNRFLQHPLQRVIVGVAIWCSLETLWSYTPLHWTTFALTQSPHNLPILQLLSFSGTTTVTAAIVAFNGLLAEAILLHHRGNQFPKVGGFITSAIALLVSLHLAGWLLYLQPSETSQDQAIRVGIIQGNIPNTIKLYPEGWRKAIDGYTTGYTNLAQGGADAILTPETALPFQWTQQVNRIKHFSRLLGKPLLASVTNLLMANISAVKQPREASLSSVRPMMLIIARPCPPNIMLRISCGRLKPIAPWFGQQIQAILLLLIPVGIPCGYPV